MTYGENFTALRDGVAVLLSHHRIQHRLAQPGLEDLQHIEHLAQRREYGDQIQRYRMSVLIWCSHAMEAGGGPRDLSNSTSLNRGPLDDLRYRLDKAIKRLSSGRATLPELTTAHPVEVVELWRTVAHAAVLGHHDFGAGVEFRSLSEPERMVVASDAAGITQGLLLLDQRYAAVPGWERLAEPGRLGRAAHVAAAFATYDEPDYRVDERGWRPAPTRSDEPADGLRGVVQAQHNLLIALGEFPVALNLRRMLHSQALLSHHAALLCPASEQAERFLARRDTHRSLVFASEEIAGIIGNGGQAAADSMAAVSRVRGVRAGTVFSNDQWQELERSFWRVDSRLATTIEHGVADRLYFTNAPLPRLFVDDPGLVKEQRVRYRPITSDVRSEFLFLVRQRLQPGVAVPLLTSAARRESATREHRVDRPPPRAR